MVDKQLGCCIFCHGVVGFVFKFCSNRTNFDFSTPFLMRVGGVVSVRERCPRWCRVRHPCRLRYTSVVGRINIQILNYPESFHFIGEGQAIRGVRGWPAIAQAIYGHQAIHGWSGPSADGLGPLLAPNTSRPYPRCLAPSLLSTTTWPGKKRRSHHSRVSTRSPGREGAAAFRRSVSLSAAPSRVKTSSGPSPSFGLAWRRWPGLQRCVCLPSCIWYPATCIPKGYGSDGLIKL